MRWISKAISIFIVTSRVVVVVNLVSLIAIAVVVVNVIADFT